MQDLPTGWVGQRRRRSGQERVQRGGKQKASSFTTLWGRLDPGTHCTHPRYNRSSGIYRSGVSPARGTEQAQFSQTPCEGSPTVLICKGDTQVQPCAAGSGESWGYPMPEGSTLGCPEDASRRSLRHKTPGSCKSQRTQDLRSAILRCPVIHGQYYTPPPQEALF